MKVAKRRMEMAIGMEGLGGGSGRRRRGSGCHLPLVG